MNKILFISILVLIQACSSFVSENRAPANEKNGEYRKSLIVHKNNGTELEIEIGRLHGSQSNYRMYVYFEDEAIKKAEPVSIGDKFTFPVTKSGYYRIYFKRMGGWANLISQYWVIWDQFIFTQPELKTTTEAISEIAKRFSPVVLTPEEEKFYPVTLDYMFNKKDKDEKLDQEIFHLKVKKESRHYSRIPGARHRNIYFPYKDILKVLPFNSDRIAVLNIPKSHRNNSRLKTRFGTEDETAIYYSYFEQDNNLIINYHTLYTYDPKNTEEASGAHAFDRESITLVYDLVEQKPTRMIYGAHLDTQRLGVIDKLGNRLQKWTGGRVSLSWDQVPKLNERPVVSSALGSHAFFPFPGDYQVYLKKHVAMLTENAGGNRVLYPEVAKSEMNNSSLGSGSRSYKLIDLEMGRISSFSWNRPLLFSGDFVDVLDVPFLTNNASFPPYTGREMKILKYISKKFTYKWQVELTSDEVKKDLELQISKIKR
jgi:hypothetical protein